MQVYDHDPLDAEGALGDAFAASRGAFDALVATLAGVPAGGWTHDQLEEHLERDGRELLRLLYQDHLDLRALRERHAVATGAIAPITDASGIGHHRVEPGHFRHLTTVFGTVRVTRCAWRAAGAPNLYPADAALNLPTNLHSHSLRRRAAIEAARGSFGAAEQAITRACGKVAAKRQVEQLTMAAARDIDAFYAATTPQPATDDTLLILSVDGKGIVMRPEALREATRKAAAAKGASRFQTRLASGEKQGRKRMATLGTVYDATPTPRRPHHIMTPTITMGDAERAGGAGDGGDGGGRRHRTGPIAAAKWLIGSIAATSEQVITAVFDHATQRDPTHRRTWVVLVDGARHQLDLIQAEAARRNVTIHILVDFIHVLEYLWRAGWCFHDDGDPATEPWVAAHALRILAGDASGVIAALSQQTSDTGLTAQQRHGVDSCIGYLTSKKEFLGYDTALTRGWPIATGVIEGACRHLVGDRLDVTGARWGLQGAEAVLKLRAMWSNGDLPAYWQFHFAQEHQRVHHARYQHPPAQPDQQVPEIEPHPSRFA